MLYLELCTLTAENPTSPSSLLIFPPLSEPAMDPVKAEKETAMRRYRRLQKIAKLFRLLEVIAALLLLSWSSVRLPAAARLSGDFLRRLAAVLLSPRFVFLLGNTIILVLFAKSRHLSSSTDGVGGDIHDQFLETRGRIDFPPPPPPTLAAQEEVVFEDKTVCMEIRACRRSRSEKIDRRRKSPELRRAGSDVGPKGAKPPPPPPEAPAAAENERKMSSDDDEEFRHMIEAFIAKQTRFHREESMAIVSAEGPQLLIPSAGSPEPNIFN
ncbi:uncharacterized protein [Elaeis guineensis]|uniref:Uncharacterized protein LOC105048538 n=1 Tax=Elaeis guineensis var. tenera TaxID=51953 RepID=A0A6I9RGH5_ELAGV|nr:uncharacterized protein LOC105048538 [Elaeis guineensis]